MAKRISAKKLNGLLSNLSYYYQKSLSISNWFGGPSIYFHRQCIDECKKNFLLDRHIELIYATLVSWGLHRMGDPSKTAKLVNFCKFKKSIIDQRENLLFLRRYDLTKIDEARLEGLIDKEIRRAFFKLDVSTSKSKLVANSKALHHLLPRLVPPADRRHTMMFFYGNTYVPKNREAQYERFSEIMRKMHFLVTKLVKRKRFSDLRNLKRHRDFNTSYTKIADNLIISCIRYPRRPKHTRK